MPHVDDARGGGWRKRGCKCALLGRAVPGYFRNQDSTCVPGGRTWSVENSTDRLSILDLAMLVADESKRRCRRSLSLVVTMIALPSYTV